MKFYKFGSNILSEDLLKKTLRMQSWDRDLARRIVKANSIDPELLKRIERANSLPDFKFQQ